MDSLTILHADKPAAKRIHLDNNGELAVGAIEPSYLHDVDIVPVEGLAALHEQLETLQDISTKAITLTQGGV